MIRRGRSYAERALVHGERLVEHHAAWCQRVANRFEQIALKVACDNDQLEGSAWQPRDRKVRTPHPQTDPFRVSSLDSAADGIKPEVHAERAKAQPRKQPCV